MNVEIKSTREVARHLPNIEDKANGTFKVPFSFHGEVLYSTFDLDRKKDVLKFIGYDRRMTYKQATQCYVKSPYSFIYPAVWKKSDTTKLVKISRLLLGIEDQKIFADHVDGNTLDNRMSNLRIANRNQNNFNAAKRHNTSSKYKGVHWNKNYQCWVAQIFHYKKRYGLGHFNLEAEAAKAYNVKCIELFGEFAKLNLIKED